MAINFKNINYLKNGNVRQRQAYADLSSTRLFQLLEGFDPILTGTIPIGIDLPTSDLDVVCTCADHEQFSKLLQRHFSGYQAFALQTMKYKGTQTTICHFRTFHFEVEIFAQATPSEAQIAYRHMMVEHALLERYGAAFRQKIIALKREGLKTEPAFAQALGLEGDPYEALLNIEF